MHQSQCKCFHHKVHKLVLILAFVTAIGFWVGSWWKMRILGISPTHFFKEFVVFSLIGIGMYHGCKCCCGGCANCSVSNQ